MPHKVHQILDLPIALLSQYATENSINFALQVCIPRFQHFATVIAITFGPVGVYSTISTVCHGIKVQYFWPSHSLQHLNTQYAAVIVLIFLALNSLTFCQATIKMICFRFALNVVNYQTQTKSDVQHTSILGHVVSKTRHYVRP